MDAAGIDQIITTERRRHFWRSFWSYAALTIFFGGITVSILCERGAPLPAFLITNPEAAGITGWLIAVAIMIPAFLLTRPPEGAQNPAVMQRQIETYQGR